MRKHPPGHPPKRKNRGFVDQTNRPAEGPSDGSTDREHTEGSMAKHPMRDAVWLFLTAWLTMATVLCARGASQDHAGWIDKVDADYRNAPPEAVEAWKDLKYGMRIHWGVY